MHLSVPETATAWASAVLESLKGWELPSSRESTEITGIHLSLFLLQLRSLFTTLVRSCDAPWRGGDAPLGGGGPNEWA